MGFNYAREKRKFDKEWRKLAEQYIEAGFDTAGIQAMHDFDWELFCQRRTYENSEQELPSAMIDDSDGKNRSTLFRKFPSLTVSFDENSLIGRYGWMEAVTDPLMTDKLSRLTGDDVELLTLLVFDEYQQTEIAAMQACTQQAVSKKIKRIKIFLK